MKKTTEDISKQYSITEEWLRWAYVEKQMSLPDIKKEKSICYRAILRLLDGFGIPKRTASESGKTERFKSKYKKTCQSRYGVDNVSQTIAVKVKKANTFVKNYGVDNIWKSKKYYEWLNSFCLEKFGTKRIGVATWTFDRFSKKGKEQWANLSTEEREKRIGHMLYNLHKKSSSKANRIEVKVFNFLDSLGITFTRQYRIGRLIYDFCIPEWKLLVEVNGDFWHANPDKYQSTDLIPFPFRDKMVLAGELWIKDKKKIDFAKENGYSVVTIWESELKREDYAIVLFDRIKNEISQNTENRIAIETVRSSD